MRTPLTVSISRLPNSRAQKMASGKPKELQFAWQVICKALYFSRAIGSRQGSPSSQEAVVAVSASDLNKNGNDDQIGSPQNHHHPAMGMDGHNSFPGHIMMDHGAPFGGPLGGDHHQQMMAPFLGGEGMGPHGGPSPPMPPLGLGSGVDGIMDLQVRFRQSC